MTWCLGNLSGKQTRSRVRPVFAAVIMSPAISAKTLHACGKMTPASQSPPST